MGKILLIIKYHRILIKDGSDNVTVFTLVSDETTTDTDNNLSNIYKNEVSYKYQIAPIKNTKQMFWILHPIKLVIL